MPCVCGSVLEHIPPQLITWSTSSFLPTKEESTRVARGLEKNKNFLKSYIHHQDKNRLTMRSVKRHEVCTTILACSCSKLQPELNLSWVFVFAVIFSSGSGTELKLLRLMFICACCSQDFYLEVIVSFSLITKKLAGCLHWIMWSICCSYQSKSGEQFHPASPAPHVILSMAGSEFSHSCQLLQLQNGFVTMACVQAHEMQSKKLPMLKLQTWNNTADTCGMSKRS